MHTTYVNTVYAMYAITNVFTDYYGHGKTYINAKNNSRTHPHAETLTRTHVAPGR